MLRPIFESYGYVDSYPVTAALSALGTKVSNKSSKRKSKSWVKVFREHGELLIFGNRENTYTGKDKDTQKHMHAHRHTETHTET